MKIHTKNLLIALCCVVLLAFAACGGGGETETPPDPTKAKNPNVTIHELGDCDKLNPILSSSANSTYVESNIFWGLLKMNPKTLEYEGQLAVGRPEIKNVTEGKSKYYCFNIAGTKQIPEGMLLYIPVYIQR